jgi:hypothetical protein
MGHLPVMPLWSANMQRYKFHQDGHRMVRVMVSRERLAGVVQALAGATATPQ